MTSSPSETTKAIKDFVALNRSAVLSTVSTRVAGHPFGSVVLYDIDSAGRITIFVSTISEHYKNLLKNPNASVFIADHFGAEDPHNHSRVTILGSFTELAAADLEQAAASYAERFPNAVDRSIAHTFRYFRLTPVKVRWILGFGSMGWLEGPAFESAELDKIAYAGMDILAHMNSDHPDALLDYLRGYGESDEQHSSAKMVAINSNEFEIAVQAASGEKRIKIPFPEALSEVSEVRGAMIAMLKKCRATPRV